MNSVNWANIFWAQLTTGSAIAQADLDSWLTTFQTNYKTRFAPVEGGQVTFTLAKATLFAPGGGALTSTVAMSGTGTEAGTTVNNDATAKVVSWITNVYWRGGKPRSYIPGVVVADTSNNNALGSTARTNLSTAANNFRSDVNANTVGTISGSSFGFVSFRSGNADRVPPVFFTISGAAAHPRLGTQRRRLGRWTN